MNNNILPSLRKDINGEVYEENGKEFLLLSDPFGYAPQPVSLPIEFTGFLNFLDGSTSLESIKSEFEKNYPLNDVKEFIDSFKDLLNFLDYMGYLQTPRLNLIKEDVDNYLNSSVRQPYCAGSSYSDKKEDLADELNVIFSTVKPEDIKPGAEMIVVPHIDFRIGQQAHKAYASGYHALRDSNPDLVVIFGTSHYGSSKRFILTEKNFETPLGIAVNAVDIIDSLRDFITDSDEVIIDDICHRYEHSIEFQVLLSQYYFKNNNIKILPILINSFADYINNKTTPDKDPAFKHFIDILKQIIKSKGYNPVYIASADLAHIGRKFGDDFDASDHLKTLKIEDNLLIHHLASNEPNAFFKQVALVKDKNKICGLAPIYTAMHYFKPKESRFLSYDIWHETETKSAVSFASLAFYR